MVRCYFTFDIIILSIDAPSLETVSDVAVDLRFHQYPLKITSCSQNLNNFRSGCSLEFIEDSKILHRALSENSFQLFLSYDYKIIAESQLIWSSAILKRINGTNQEITYKTECELESVKLHIGQIDLLVRIQCVPTPRVNQIITRSPFRSNVGINIGQFDHFSLTHDLTLHNPKDEEKCNKFNKKSCSSELVEFQKFRKHFEDLLKISLNIANFPQQANFLKCFHSPGYKTNSEELSIKQYTILSQHGRLCGGCCTASQNKVVNCLCKPKSPPTNPNLLGQRHCIMCNVNRTWLPTWYPCSSCGYISVLHKDEKTANKILHHICKDSNDPKRDRCNKAEENRENMSFCSNMEEKKECTCQYKKNCSQCRVRAICTDIVNECKKRQKDVLELEFFHLSRVFSELKDMYELKPAFLLTEDKKYILNRNCEKEMFKSLKNHKKNQQIKKVYLDRIFKLIHNRSNIGKLKSAINRKDGTKFFESQKYFQSKSRKGFKHNSLKL